MGGGCWLVWSASWALEWSCLPLSPIVSGCLPSCGVLVGVAVVSGCLPSCGRWVLVGVVGFLGSEVVLSPVVSHCHRLSPFMWGGCWLVWSASWALKWSCLQLSPVVSLHVGVGCWSVWPPSWALKWSCLPLSPFMWGVGVGWCGRLLGF